VSRPADPTGYGEAYEYIGTTIGDIDGNFMYVIPNTYPFYSAITATATDSLGNTSEFCENFALIPGPLTIYAYGYEAPGKSCPVIRIRVIDPAGDSIGYNDDAVTFDQTIFPAQYIEEYGGGDCLEKVVIDYPLMGEYKIFVIDVPGGSDEPTYTIGVQIDGSSMSIAGEGQLIGSETATLTYTVGEYFAGDANGDGTINILDITFLIAYLYKGGPPPVPVEAADADCNGMINILDITTLINYLYKGGPQPDCP